MKSIIHKEKEEKKEPEITEVEELEDIVRQVVSMGQEWIKCPVCNQWTTRAKGVQVSKNTTEETEFYGLESTGMDWPRQQFIAITEANDSCPQNPIPSLMHMVSTKIFCCSKSCGVAYEL